MTPEERAKQVMQFLADHGILSHHPTPKTSATVREGIELAVRAAVMEEREACVADVAGAMSEQGTDDPHEALDWAIAAIRARAGANGPNSPLFRGGLIDES